MGEMNCVRVEVERSTNDAVLFAANGRYYPDLGAFAKVR